MVVELLGLYESTLISVLVTEYLSGMLTRELNSQRRGPARHLKLHRMVNVYSTLQVCGKGRGDLL
jgi:hypothetical protein